jgi:hypothetical protein
MSCASTASIARASQVDTASQGPGSVFANTWLRGQGGCHQLGARNSRLAARKCERFAVERAWPQGHATHRPVRKRTGCAEMRTRDVRCRVFGLGPRALRAVCGLRDAATWCGAKPGDGLLFANPEAQHGRDSRQARGSGSTNSGLATRGWQLEAGNSGLATGGWQLGAGNSGLATRGWQLGAGNSGLATRGSGLDRYLNRRIGYR